MDTANLNTENKRISLTKSSAEKRLADMSMGDLPVMEFRIQYTTVSPDWFTKYKDLSKQFIRSLTDSVESLAFLNLTQEEFMDLIMGKKIPLNLSLRLRVPLLWGGKLEINNMFLCRTFPHSYNMERFIIEQSGADTIWLPNPALKVYIPAHTAGGGTGGNATEDRLSQMAAQIVANRGME